MQCVNPPGFSCWWSVLLVIGQALLFSAFSPQGNAVFACSNISKIMLLVVQNYTLSTCELSFLGACSLCQNRSEAFASQGPGIWYWHLFWSKRPRHSKYVFVDPTKSGACHQSLNLNWQKHLFLSARGGVGWGKRMLTVLLFHFFLCWYSPVFFFQGIV